MRVGGSVVLWMGGRAGSWLCMVHVFAVLLSGPMVLSSLTRRWSAAFELDTRLLLYVIAVPRYCCSTWWVGGPLRGCIHVFVGGCVGGCVGSYVVDCMLWILRCGW